MKAQVRVGIVDDELHGRKYIASLLANEFPNLVVAFMAVSVAEANRFLECTEMDILFLDVELGDGTAFDVLARTEPLSIQVIFTTAYEQYALKALKNDATDYLLKPIKKNEFTLAVNKALDRLEQKAILKKESLRASVNLRTLHEVRKTYLSEIVRCEADSNYTTIYLTDRSKIIIAKTLHDFESHLASQDFFRIHHKHLINLSHFMSYQKGSGGQVTMSDGSLVDVSIRRRNEFLARIGKAF